MPAIIPNRTALEGRVVSIRKSPDIENFSIMEVQPTHAWDAGNSLNLLKKSGGAPLHVHISEEVQKQYGLKEGCHISAMIRSAPDNLFVIPDTVRVK
jgi:hypothetical protein